MRVCVCVSTLESGRDVPVSKLIKEDWPIVLG